VRNNSVADNAALSSFV